MPTQLTCSNQQGNWATIVIDDQNRHKIEAFNDKVFAHEMDAFWAVNPSFTKKRDVIVQIQEDSPNRHIIIESADKYTHDEYIRVSISTLEGRGIYVDITGREGEINTNT